MTTHAIVQIKFDTLEQFMPFHIILDIAGRISHAGAGLLKLCGGRALIGQDFFKTFTVKRPHDIHRVGQFDSLSRSEIMIVPKFDENLIMGVELAVLPNGQGYLLDTSIGLKVFDFLQDETLSFDDFSNTDQTKEMLRLSMFQSTVSTAARGLNTQLDNAKSIAENQAYSDPLTGLGNRRALDRYLNRLMSGEQTQPFAVVLIDLDFFKTINDGLGHAAGDYVLVEIAQRLQLHIRPSDMAARIGGDEFVLVLPDFKDRGALEPVMQRLLSRLHSPVYYNGKPCRIGASIGATLTTSASDISIDEIMTISDKALYDSKNQGRGRANIIVRH